MKMFKLTSIGLTVMVRAESSQAISVSAVVSSCWARRLAARTRTTPKLIIRRRKPAQTITMIVTVWPINHSIHQLSFSRKKTNSGRMRKLTSTAGQVALNSASHAGAHVNIGDGRNGTDVDVVPIDLRVCGGGRFALMNQHLLRLGSAGRRLSRFGRSRRMSSS